MSARRLDAELTPGLFVDADSEIAKIVFGAELPTATSVRRGVNFDNGADASHSGVCYYGFYVVGGVGLVRGVSTVPSSKYPKIS